MKTLVFGLFAIGILITSNSYGFGRKKMQLSELKGVTETQVAKQTGKAMIMVRGKAAELIFRMMKREREERTDSEALKWIGSKSGSEMIVKGRQITCSMISWGKKKHEDYACSFEMDRTGTLSATKTAFSPTTFNLAKTSTGSKAFKEKGRSLASVTPTTTYSKGLAYLVYDKPGNQKRAENAMIVFQIGRAHV